MEDEDEEEEEKDEEEEEEEDVAVWCLRFIFESSGCKVEIRCDVISGCDSNLRSEFWAERETTKRRKKRAEIGIGRRKVENGRRKAEIERRRFKGAKTTEIERENRDVVLWIQNGFFKIMTAQEGGGRSCVDGSKRNNRGCA